MSGETGRDRPDWWLHEVPETEDGTRIDRYLRRLVTGLSQGPVEKMLRTGLMKNLGYGKDYAYDHDDPDGFAGQNGFPDGMQRQRFYTPVERGYEREIGKRLAYWDRLRADKSGGGQ